VDPRAKTELGPVCVDADVVVAGLFSTKGASHAVLVLGEIGVLRLSVPAAAVEQIRRNVNAKLPAALPSFERFLASPAVTISTPRAADLARAKGRAHPGDEPILAGAYASRANLLVTHNVRHFRVVTDVRVVRPAKLVEEVRAWMAGFGA